MFFFLINSLSLPLAYKYQALLHHMFTSKLECNQQTTHLIQHIYLLCKNNEILFLCFVHYCFLLTQPHFRCQTFYITTHQMQKEHFYKEVKCFFSPPGISRCKKASQFVYCHVSGVATFIDQQVSVQSWVSNALNNYHCKPCYCLLSSALSIITVNTTIFEPV